MDASIIKQFGRIILSFGSQALILSIIYTALKLVGIWAQYYLHRIRQ